MKKELRALEELDVKRIEVLRIFLEYPGGLHFSELWKIVNQRNVCAKQTLVKILKDLEERGLVVVNDLGRYTLGFSEELSQKIIKGCYELQEDVQKFIEILYKEYEHAKEQSSLFAQVAIAYIEAGINLMNFIAWSLFPFFFDVRVRQVWFLCHKYALDFICEKMNDISQQLIGVKLSDLFLEKSVQDIYLKPQLESNTLKIRQKIEDVAGLIDQLNIEDTAKHELKRLLKAILIYTI
ncbi:MAG: hypothetical protein QXJ62_01325 [Nitrososphaeria archaeon]